MDNWKKKYKRAIALAKLQPMSGESDITEKNFPFEGASLAMLPFVMEAMIDFNSRSAPELVWGKDLVAAKIYGKRKMQPKSQDPQAEQQMEDVKEARADRINDYMNYQLMEEIPSWRDEQDKNLLILPCVGTTYKKTHYNYDKKVAASELYRADQIIFNHGFNNFSDAPDKFIPRKFTKNEVIGFIRGEQGWDLEEGDLEEDEDEFDFIECYTWFDLDDDGLKEPYCAIMSEDKSKIVALYPDYDEDTIIRNDDNDIVCVESLDTITQYKFIPDPEGGPMGMGWGILLGPMFDSINTSLRQMIDASTLANAASNSGFITVDLATGFGNSTQSGPQELRLGQLTPINIRGGSLKDAIFQPPFAGANTVQFQLMDYLINAARSMSNASVNVEAVQGEAAALYLARLQQGLKVPNSIIMRIYSAAQQEIKKIALLNHKHYDDERYNKVLDRDIGYSMQKDFDPDDCDIRLAVDPAQGSDIERIQRADTILQEAKTQPQTVLNLREAYLGWLKALGEPDIETLAPKPDPNAVDPMQQMMIAQMQFEAELKQEELGIRKSKNQLEQQKLAMQAAKEMTSLGMDAEEQEAKITKIYAETLKLLVEAGVSGYEQALVAAKEIEDQFIAEGGENGGQVPTSNQSSARTMAGGPGNDGVIDSM